MTKTQDKAVLITGATGSVGERLVAVFAEKGYRVFFLYHRSESRAHALAERFGATPMQEDLSGPINLANKEVDILINNAAINETTELTGDLPFGRLEPHDCSEPHGAVSTHPAVPPSHGA